MFKRLLIVSFLLTFPLMTLAVSPPRDLEFSGLAHKVLGGPDEDGDLKISIKVTVRNTTGGDQDVKVVVRAVDNDHYEVFDVELSGKVKAGETRTLTDTQYINEKLYKTIARWEIED